LARREAPKVFEFEIEPFFITDYDYFGLDQPSWINEPSDFVFLEEDDAGSI
jgi:hypothetical protein